MMMMRNKVEHEDEEKEEDNENRGMMPRIVMMDIPDVWLTSVVASMLAPCLRSNSTTLILFFLQAMCRGVKPLRARALGSALRSSNSLATRTCPQ